MAEILDKSIGLEVCGGDEDLFAVILESYVEESQELLDKAKAAYESEDWKNYTVYVHGLKSASKSVGAMKLGDIAYQLEMASKEDDIAKVREVQPELEAVYEETLAVVKENV